MKAYFSKHFKEISFNTKSGEFFIDADVEMSTPNNDGSYDIDSIDINSIEFYLNNGKRIPLKRSQFAYVEKIYGGDMENYITEHEWSFTEDIYEAIYIKQKKQREIDKHDPTGYEGIIGER